MPHCASPYSRRIALNGKEGEGKDKRTESAAPATLLSAGCLHVYLINYAVNDWIGRDHDY
jgi:hypothetical protein